MTVREHKCDGDCVSVSTSVTLSVCVFVSTSVTLSVCVFVSTSVTLSVYL